MAHGDEILGEQARDDARGLTHTGVVVSVNVSAGGLPKLPVERAPVSGAGMAGGSFGNPSPG